MNTIEQELQKAKEQGILFSDDGSELIRAPKNIIECVVPRCVRKLCEKAFFDANQLKKITLQDGLQEIGEDCFHGCNNLVNVFIPNTVTTIGARCFQGCENFTNCTIPNRVVYINDATFANCKLLIKVALPDGVTSIGAGAFGGCSSLSSVTIPDGVTSIGDGAFEGCSSLSSVTIPDSVKSITIPDWEKRYHFFRDTPWLNRQLEEERRRRQKEERRRQEEERRRQEEERRRQEEERRRQEEEKRAQQNQGCYIATAVYGSYDCPQVWTLRRYRDSNLASSLLGRLFIHTYYAVSPTLVRWFGNKNWFKSLWKKPLDRMVAKLKVRGIEDTPYQDRKW